MKKILIVSYYYSPANIIGAVRASKLSKYFNLQQFDVNVICSKDNKLLFMPGEIKIDETLKKDTDEISKLYISHSSNYHFIANLILKISKKIYIKSDSYEDKKLKVSNKGIYIKTLVKKIIHFFVFIFSLLQDLDFLNQVKKQMKTINKIEYDVIISSYGPVASHFVGSYLKDNNPNAIWIADFRDPIAQPTNGILEYKINKKIEKNICNKADIVTAVSQGYLNEITKGSENIKSFVITNGFDTDDLKYVEESLNDDFFSFVYTGTTYAGRRDLSPIFRVLRELIDEEKINKEKVIFRYAGSEKNYIKLQANKFNLEDILELYDFIPRIDALKLQAKSSFLIVSTWNENRHTGVLPGKFLEYLMFKSPIISIVNGNQNNSEIGEIIRDYKLGNCYEAINSNNDFLKLKEYILYQYQNFTKYGRVLYEADINKVNNHNYKNIAEKFINIFSK